MIPMLHLKVGVSTPRRALRQRGQHGQRLHAVLEEGLKQRNVAPALPYPSGIPECSQLPPCTAPHPPYLQPYPSQVILDSPRSSFLKPS